MVLGIMLFRKRWWWILNGNAFCSLHCYEFHRSQIFRIPVPADKTMSTEAHVQFGWVSGMYDTHPCISLDLQNTLWREESIRLLGVDVCTEIQQVVRNDIPEPNSHDSHAQLLSQGVQCTYEGIQNTAGDFTDVAGNGICWMYSVRFRYIWGIYEGHPSKRDFIISSSILDHMKSHSRHKMKLQQKLLSEFHLWHVAT